MRQEPAEEGRQEVLPGKERRGCRLCAAGGSGRPAVEARTRVLHLDLHSRYEAETSPKNESGALKNLDYTGLRSSLIHITHPRVLKPRSN
jgi:hypothetical protein